MPEDLIVLFKRVVAIVRVGSRRYEMRGSESWGKV
jgi:hypothetical protein